MCHGCGKAPPKVEGGGKCEGCLLKLRRRFRYCLVCDWPFHPRDNEGICGRFPCVQKVNQMAREREQAQGEQQ